MKTTRRERKNRAELRRNALKIKWCDTVIAAINAGTAWKQALRDVASDVDEQCKTTPQEKGETIRALGEFCSDFSAKAKTTNETT